MFRYCVFSSPFCVFPHCVFKVLPTGPFFYVAEVFGPQLTWCFQVLFFIVMCFPNCLKDLSVHFEDR